MVDMHEPHTENEHRMLERAGLWVVVGVIAAMLLASAVLFALRPHTVMLTPGQPQSPLVSTSGR
jgi:hypothetical protein